MSLGEYPCIFGDSNPIGYQKVGPPGERGGGKLSDNPGQTGGGWGLKIPILAGRPFMNATLEGIAMSCGVLERQLRYKRYKLKSI